MTPPSEGPAPLAPRLGAERLGISASFRQAVSSRGHGAL
jgi:hypothetical protein